MARKKIQRSLPAVKSLFKSFKGFPAKSSRQLLLLNELRSAAKALRTKSPRPFYAMREISLHFKVPLRTVAIAYEQLELEGILNRIRGSKTLLAGKSLSPRKPVRAVVGIPVSFHAIVVSPYSRALHLELEERLRNYGYVADIIFFRDDEVANPDFAERLQNHNLDYLIWHTPHSQANQVLLSLKDHGVRQILVQSIDNPNSLPVTTYFQDWQHGYKLMAEEWKKLGILTVIVPEPSYLSSKRALKSFSLVMTAARLRVIMVKNSAQDILHAAMKMPRKSYGVAFLDQMDAEIICNQEPVIVDRILKHGRLAFCRGPIRAPYFIRRDAAVDLVRFLPSEIAARLADGIRNYSPPSETPGHTFHSVYENQVSFRNNVEIL